MLLVNHGNQMMNLLNHTSKGGTVLLLHNLGNLMKPQGGKSPLLICRSTNLTLYLLNLYRCHMFASYPLNTLLILIPREPATV